MDYIWVYQAGNAWMPLDEESNAIVEKLYHSCRDGYVLIHEHQAYVNAQELYLQFVRNGVSVAIARTFRGNLQVMDSYYA